MKLVTGSCQYGRIVNLRGRNFQRGCRAGSCGFRHSRVDLPFDKGKYVTFAGAMPCWSAEAELTLVTNAAMILKLLQALYTLSRWERAGVEGEGDSPAPWREEVWSQTMDGLL